MDKGNIKKKTKNIFYAQDYGRLRTTSYSLKNIFSLLFIILGVFIGTSIFAIYTSFTAHGADDPADSVNWWNTAIAEIDTHGFKDVFEEAFLASATNTTSLYRIVSSKLRLQPQNDAIKIMAENHNMTEDEVAKIINGDVNTLLQFGDASGVKGLSESQTEYLLAVSDNFRQEYFDLYEQYKIKADVDVNIGPAEMFANGDLLDSGFDLVHDLSLIEYILFEKNTESDVGGTYSGATDSPVPSGAGSGGNNGGVGNGGTDEGDKNWDGDNVAGAKKGIPQIKGGVAKIALGGNNNISAEVLTEDNCPVDLGTGLKDALNNFNTENGNGAGGNNKSGGNNGDGNLNDANDLNDNNGNDNGSGGDGGSGATSTPPPAGEWGSTFCPSLGLDAGVEPAEGPGNMSGLGGSDGDPFNADGPPFTFNVAVCFTLELVTGKVTAGSSTTCIQCEIEQMLAALDEAASDSLMPNKPTGNIFEPAKCKKALAPDIKGFLDGTIKIIFIASPIQTPPDDDMVLDINMYKSWNQFVNKSWLLDFAKLDESYTKRLDLEAAIPDNSAAELIAVAKAELLSNQNRAAAEINSRAIAEMANLPITYAEPVLAEMARMRTTFASYGQMFSQVFEVSCDKEIE